MSFVAIYLCTHFNNPHRLSEAYMRQWTIMLQTIVPRQTGLSLLSNSGINRTKSIKQTFNASRLVLQLSLCSVVSNFKSLCKLRLHVHVVSYTSDMALLCPDSTRHYNDAITSVIASQINRLFRHRSEKTFSSASLAFVGEIDWWLVDSPYKGSVVRKIVPFDHIVRN